MRAVCAALLAVALTGCGNDPPPRAAEAPAAAQADSPAITRSEPRLTAAEMTALSREFGLPGCTDVTRLPTVAADGLVAESSRVREGTACFDGWAGRQQRYALLALLDRPQAQRDRLPWLCSETSTHVAECATQRREPMLLIHQPRGAPYLLFRRIRKVAA